MKLPSPGLVTKPPSVLEIARLYCTRGGGAQPIMPLINVTMIKKMLTLAMRHHLLKVLLYH
jgi:hypothetical protein